MAKYQSGGAPYYEATHCTCAAFRRAHRDAMWDKKRGKRTAIPSRESKYRVTEQGLEKWWYCDKCGLSSEKVVAKRVPGVVITTSYVTLRDPDTGCTRRVVAYSELRDRLERVGFVLTDYDANAPFYDGIWEAALWMSR